MTTRRASCKQPEPGDPVVEALRPCVANPEQFIASLTKRGLRLVRVPSEEERRELAAFVAAKSPSGYAQIKLNLSDAVICYGKAGGCVREDGCEDSCLMLATYEAGVRWGARAATDAMLGPVKS